MPSTKTYRILTIISALVIFAFVPIARTIEAFVKKTITSYQIPTIYIYALLALMILIFFVVYYYYLFNNYSRKTSFLHLACILLLALSFPIQIVTVAEYTHIPTYGLLTALARMNFQEHSQKKAIFYALLTCLVVAIIDEVLQGICPKRYFDLFDIVLNLSSGLMGLIILEPIVQKIQVISKA